MTDNSLVLPSFASLQLTTGENVQWDPNTQLFMTDIKGWHGSSPIRRDKSDRLGAHGSHSERGWKDERLITIQGSFFGPAPWVAEEKVEELAGLFGDGNAGTFTTVNSRGQLRTAEVYLAGDGFDPVWTGRSQFTFTIFLLAPDPRKYGTPSVSPEIGVPTEGDGLKMPLFTPSGVLDFGVAGNPGTTSLTNTGTADTGQIFTIKGTYVPGFTITETKSGRRLVYTGILRAGQELTLNSDTGAVLLDGYAPRELAVSEWVRLGRGESGVWLFESPGSVGATMKVEVRPAWW
ncbi:minor tail protein [Arthrobacter phage Huntingdon]|uniref:Minor tail protein n=1 Tax=Arthrobacter phage Huntingdon TaxID=2047760 RepID=A0A2H4PAF7_9CAUD|nr:minor tail protein [Arthrobacter phage Huntingdon]AOQ28231.1 minor tail protein [Arthrobacter phage RcigaStruga]ATW59226.1 minor tail protein [Arthrobacter phage Huntingdon]